jgi:hypothetical protein
LIPTFGLRFLKVEKVMYGLIMIFKEYYYIINVIAQKKELGTIFH